MNIFRIILGVVFGVLLTSGVFAQDVVKTVDGKPAVFTKERATLELDMEVPFTIDYENAETFGKEYKRITLPVIIKDHELAQKLREQRENSPITFGPAYERKTVKIKR